MLKVLHDLIKKQKILNSYLLNLLWYIFEWQWLFVGLEVFTKLFITYLVAFLVAD